jgi:uroporphyrinogen-III synthase
MREVEAMRVVSLEARRAGDMARLLERHGCLPISAPAMREIPLTDQHEAFAFGERLLAGECDVMVLLTGVGTRMLVDALSTRWPSEQVLAALGSVPLACRGPKPVAVLKQLGLRPTLVAPEPNTWQDLLAELDRSLPVAGRRVFVQEYGRPSLQLIAALRERGALVESVSIYGWAMPEDTRPLSAAIDSLLGREVDAIVFTSGQQVEHLRTLALEGDRVDALFAALREHVLCVSIGPVTSEALREQGIPIDLEPVHPKMGHMVSALAKEGPALLAQKRARSG